MVSTQIIVRCKQPIKIEKPLQCLLTFSSSIGGRNIRQSVLLSAFIAMPSKAVITVIQFMSESGVKHIYAREHKLCCFIILCMTHKLATGKMDSKWSISEHHAILAISPS